MPEALKRMGRYRGSDYSFLRKTAPQESDHTRQYALGLVHQQKRMLRYSYRSLFLPATQPQNQSCFY